jgi:hypothetical protein
MNMIWHDNEIVDYHPSGPHLAFGTTEVVP